jgi:hypothetical protein
MAECARSTISSFCRVFISFPRNFELKSSEISGLFKCFKKFHQVHSIVLDSFTFYFRPIRRSFRPESREFPSGTSSAAICGRTLERMDLYSKDIRSTSPQAFHWTLHSLNSLKNSRVIFDLLARRWMRFAQGENANLSHSGQQFLLVGRRSYSRWIVRVQSWRSMNAHPAEEMKTSPDRKAGDLLADLMEI